MQPSPTQVVKVTQHGQTNITKDGQKTSQFQLADEIKIHLQYRSKTKKEFCEQNDANMHRMHLQSNHKAAKLAQLESKTGLDVVHCYATASMTSSLGSLFVFYIQRKKYFRHT